MLPSACWDISSFVLKRARSTSGFVEAIVSRSSDSPACERASV
jgi:hypothetical protein